MVWVMTNEETVFEIVAACPFIGFKLDEEPYPIAEVVETRSVVLRATRIDLSLIDRRTNEEEDAALLVVYADDQPVFITRCAEEQDGR